MKKVIENEALSVYADGMKPMREDTDCVLVRCWNKTGDDLADAFAKLNDLRDVFPFDSLVLSIDRDLDAGRTLASLAGLRPPFPVLPVQVSGPQTVKNWTRLLNGPLAYMGAAGVKKGRVFCLSFETNLDLQSLADAVPLLDDSGVPCVSVRNTPASLTTTRQQVFLRGVGPDLADWIFDELADHIQDDGEFLGEADACFPFLCRNTAMIWNIDKLFAGNGFDPRCNAWGGQEELAFICGRLWKGERVNTRAVFRYDDPRLSGKDLAAQRQKLRTETESTQKILEAYRLNPVFMPDFRL